MIIGISGKKQSGKNTVALIWQYLYDYYYNFIKEYFKEMSDTIRKCDEPLDQYVVLDVLLKLNVIPSKYAKMPFNEFVSIIRLKENKK